MDPDATIELKSNGLHDQLMKVLAERVLNAEGMQPCEPPNSKSGSSTTPEKISGAQS